MCMQTSGLGLRAVKSPVRPVDVVFDKVPGKGPPPPTSPRPAWRQMHRGGALSQWLCVVVLQHALIALVLTRVFIVEQERECVRPCAPEAVLIALQWLCVAVRGCWRRTEAVAAAELAQPNRSDRLVQQPTPPPVERRGVALIPAVAVLIPVPAYPQPSMRAWSALSRARHRLCTGCA